MTLHEIQSLAAKHIDLWLNDETFTLNIKDVAADAITEAIAIRDKQWVGGKATYKHERDVAQRVAKEAQETNAQLEGMLRQAKEQVAAMEEARDNAIEAAHLLAGELESAKRAAELCRRGIKQ